jgi:hypothetical protein
MCAILCHSNRLTALHSVSVCRGGIVKGPLMLELGVLPDVSVLSCAVACLQHNAVPSIHLAGRVLLCLVRLVAGTALTDCSSTHLCATVEAKV